MNFLNDWVFSELLYQQVLIVNSIYSTQINEGTVVGAYINQSMVFKDRYGLYNHQYHELLNNNKKIN